MKKYEKPVSQSQFEEMIRKITKAESVRDGIVYQYSYDSLSNGLVAGWRESTEGSFEIKLRELLDAYNELDCDELNTSTLKKYISGRVQSPAYALLRELESSNEQNL